MFIIIPIVLSYYGNEGDCEDQHGITIIDVPFDNNAVIRLDGVPSESFWTAESNQQGFITVPLASNINEPETFHVVYLNLTIVMTTEFIYLLCKWNDSTTKPGESILYDGLFFCWNINVPNFSANFWGGMRTNIMGGGNVDAWSWICNVDTPKNGSSYLLNDESFGPNGWYISDLENDDVSVAYTYKENDYYIVELKRTLTTNDANYDVQFNEKKLYEFNMGILDNETGASHAISWTYALDLREETSGGGGGSGVSNNINNTTNSNQINDINIMINFGFLTIIITVIFLCIIILVQYYKTIIFNIKNEE